MSFFGNIWGKLDEGIDSLGNAAGEVFDAAKDSVISKLNEPPASVNRPESIPDQVQPPVSIGPTAQTSAVGQVWQQYKTPVMIGGGLVVAFLIYSAVKN